MRFIIGSAALLAMGSGALAAVAGVKNLCSTTIYVTVTNSSMMSIQYTIASNGTYSQPLAGMGNQFGITTDPSYYSTQSPKFVFGFSDSTSASLTYWSITSVDGSPFDTFLVATSEPTCTNATAYDGQVHTCTDTADIAVVLC
ncbi:hypothetical protein AAFC00_006203 [Neodothiora populina]|uniref:Uncharacterized protein n=1 Tax=Neodothiora populina TaxID=2781224 RepID=A0ABR3P4D1_9PEZI